jgi:hypothetical protein
MDKYQGIRQHPPDDALCGCWGLRVVRSSLTLAFTNPHVRVAVSLI